MRKLSFLLLALAGAASAQTPEDFAWQWPITLDGDQGAYRLVLDESVYARLARDDLRDLAVFNAQSQLVPFAPLAYAQTVREQHTPLRWLRVAAPAAGQGNTFSLRLERDSNGRVRDLQLDSQSAPATAPSTDLLIDLGDEPPRVSSLRLSLGSEAVLPVNLRVEVLASDDLAQWQTLGRDLAVVAIVDNGLRIERLRLDFAASRQRYLRLSLARGENWPAIAGIENEQRETGTAGPAWQRVELQGQPVPEANGVFEYRSPGPLPVSRIDLHLAAANTVARVQFESRMTQEAAWSPVTGFTAFRLGTGDDELRQLPSDIPLRRDRYWQLRTEPALPQAPILVLHYRPDSFVLLAQGPAPYRLLAGSLRTSRPDYPVQAALAAAGASRPQGWQPPLAVLAGGSAAAGGDAALSPDRGPQYRRWLLWAVLGIGAALVLVVSVRMLRAPPAA